MNEPLAGGLDPTRPGLPALLAWGLRSAWACRRILIFMLVANLLLAAAVVSPLYGPIDESLSFHPEAARIGRSIEARWWSDWTHAASGRVELSQGMMSAAGFFMMLAGTFFAGGLLEALRQGPVHRLTFDPLPDPVYGGATPEWRSAAPGPASLQVFLRNSARHFPRLLVLLILSLPAYGLNQLVLNRWAAAGLDRLLEHVGDERLAVVLTGLRAALFVGGFYLVTTIFEYARAAEVLRPGGTLLSVLALPIRIVRMRIRLFVGLEAAAFVLHTASVLVFMPLDRLLGWHPLVGATAGLAATQLFMFLRLWIRAAIHAAQIRLARSVLEA